MCLSLIYFVFFGCIFEMYLCGSQKLLSAYAELGEPTGCRFLQSQSPYVGESTSINSSYVDVNRRVRMDELIHNHIRDSLDTAKICRFFWFPRFIRFLWIYFWDVYLCSTCDVIRNFSMSEMSHFHPLPRNMSRSMRCKRNWHNAMRSWKPCERTWQQHMPSWRMMMMFGHELLWRGFHERGV